MSSQQNSSNHPPHLPSSAVFKAQGGWGGRPLCLAAGELLRVALGDQALGRVGWGWGLELSTSTTREVSRGDHLLLVLCPRRFSSLISSSPFLQIFCDQSWIRLYIQAMTRQTLSSASQFFPPGLSCLSLPVEIAQKAKTRISTGS